MGFSYLGSLIWVWFVDCYMQLEITERGCGSWNGLIGMDWWGPLWVSCWPLSTKSMIQAPKATLSFDSRICICKDQQTIGFMPLKLSFTFSNSSKKKKKMRYFATTVWLDPGFNKRYHPLGDWTINNPKTEIPFATEIFFFSSDLSRVKASSKANRWTDLWQCYRLGSVFWFIFETSPRPSELPSPPADSLRSHRLSIWKCSCRLKVGKMCLQSIFLMRSSFSFLSLATKKVVIRGHWSKLKALSISFFHLGSNALCVLKNKTC